MDKKAVIIAGANSLINPADLNPLLYLNADLGVSTPGGAFNWLDQAGGDLFSQATPTGLSYITNNPLANGHNSVRFNAGQAGAFLDALSAPSKWKFLHNAPCSIYMAGHVLSGSLGSVSTLVSTCDNDTPASIGVNYQASLARIQNGAANVVNSPFTGSTLTTGVSYFWGMTWSGDIGAQSRYRLRESTMSSWFQFSTFLALSNADPTGTLRLGRNWGASGRGLTGDIFQVFIFPTEHSMTTANGIRLFMMKDLNLAA